MREPSSNRRQGLGRLAIRRAAEAAVRNLIAISGWTAIAVLAAIAIFLFLNSTQAISKLGLGHMLGGTSWFPTSTPPEFGMLPAIVGSLWVTIVAMVVCIPVGIAAAIYISEFAPPRSKELLKTLIEFMAAVPSVVYGLLGLALLVQPIREIFHLQSGLSALTAGLVVGIMALPTVISISEDALHAVPNDLRQGSLALGNTRWQTIYKVTVPSAASGIFAGAMLGLGRAIGETMVVLMLAGNQNIVPLTPFASVKTLTGTIAGEMGETIRGGLHFSVLFAMGLVLFVVTFLVNFAADIVLERQRRRWRR